jgi:hypothetical protein
MKELIDNYCTRIDGDFSFINQTVDIGRRLSEEIKETSAIGETLLFVRDYCIIWLKDPKDKSEFIAELEQNGFFHTLESFLYSDNLEKIGGAIYTFGKLRQSNHYQALRKVISKYLDRKDFLSSKHCLSEMLWLDHDKGIQFCTDEISKNVLFYDLVIFSVLSHWTPLTENYPSWFVKSKLNGIMQSDIRKHSLELSMLEKKISNELYKMKSSHDLNTGIKIQKKMINDFINEKTAGNSKLKI